MLKKALSYKKIANIYFKIKNSGSYQSLLLAFTQSLVAVFVVTIDFFYSKGLSVAEFGVWKKLMFVAGMIIPVFSFGIPEGYKYFIAKEGKFKYAFVNTYSALSVIAFSLFILLALANLGHVLQLYSLENFYLISLLLPLTYFAFVLNKTLRYAYIDRQKIQQHTYITIAAFAFTFIGLLAYWYNFQQLKSFYLWLGIIFYTSLFLIPLPFLIKSGKFPIKLTLPSKAYLKKVLKQGVPLYLATFIGVATLNMDKLIVTYFEDTETFAIFSVGALEIPIFAMLSAAFSQKIYPQLVRLVNADRKEDAKKIWMDTTIKVSYFTYPLILVMMFFAEEILFFIYSDVYKESVILFKTYLLVALFRNNYYGAIITASGQTKYITLYSGLMLAFNFIISIFLYHFIGINGIVFGTLFSTILIQCLQLNHENLLKVFLVRIFTNYKIVLLILGILIVYFLN